MKSLTSSNLPMKNNLIILEEVSTKPRIKSLQEQVNNSTLVKPKEIEKFSEEKSSDINQNKRLRVIYKTRKGLRSFARSSDRVFNFTKKRNSI